MQDVASAAHTTSTELEAEVLRREQLQERVQELEVMPLDLHTRRHTHIVTHAHMHAATALLHALTPPGHSGEMLTPPSGCTH